MKLVVILGLAKGGLSIYVSFLLSFFSLSDFNVFEAPDDFFPSVILGNYHSQGESRTSDGVFLQPPSVEGTVDQVLQHEKPAAGLICQLETEQVGESSQRALFKDILGVVATLGKVAEANLSRYFHFLRGEAWLKDSISLKQI